MLTSIQWTSAWPARRTASAGSASPPRTASARSAIAPAKRWTRRRTMIPSPIATPAPDSAAGTTCRATSARRERAGPPHNQGVGGRADEVAEHGAGLDRSELLRVSHEDKPCFAADGLEQARSQRERHHRGLVDDDDVVRQLVVA